VVESTYNGYWLMDGLREAKYQVHLANPAEIQQYSGTKYTDDKWDSGLICVTKIIRLK